MPGRDLNLLSLDGGGVRGLSSLYTLQRIMESIDPEDPPKPCDYFDMIGGTSTGGLIAIMLGRLRMTIDECIQAYIELSEEIFHKKRRIPVNAKGDLKERYDSKTLEIAIKKVIRSRDMDEDALLKDPQGTKVFVCCTSGETSTTALLRSYHSTRGANDLYRTVRIWEAARATSAASTFFDPIQIGENGQRFLDGGTVANNPVRQLWGEAVDMIDQQALTNDLNCLISIGTGEPSYKGFDDTVMGIVNTLSSIATETEETANSFHQEQSRLFDKRVCYRYNVPRGMGDIGLAETEQRAAIKSMTDAYLQSELVQSSMRSCVRVLKQRQSHSHKRSVLLLKQVTQAEDDSFHVMSQNPNWQLASTESEVYDMLERISSYQPNRTHHRIQLQKLGETARWILKDKVFCSWLSDDATRCFWLSGIVGCGKTLVANTVIQALLDRQTEASNSGPVVYFYFDGNKRDVLRAEDFFRSCIKQLLRYIYTTELQPSRQVQSAVKRFFRAGTPSPSYDEIIQILLIPLARQFSDLTLAVDGLDVCSREEYIMALETLDIVSREASIKLFVSGRRELEVTRRIPGSIHLEITTKKNGPDLAFFTINLINRRMRERRLSDNERIIQCIKETLIQEAEGMFLWVRLQIEMLWRTCNTDAQIEKALLKLPEDLDETYERCLKRVRDNESEYALKVLWYVYGARTPLTIQALREALAVDSGTGQLRPGDIPSEHLVIDCGANLVFLDTIENLVLPAHHSVRQFLGQSNSEVLRQLKLPVWKDAELDLGQTCILYLWWLAFSADAKDERADSQSVRTLHIKLPSVSRMGLYIPQPFRFWNLFATRHRSGISSIDNDSPIQLEVLSRNTVFGLYGPFCSYAQSNLLNLTRHLGTECANWPQFLDLVLSWGYGGDLQLNINIDDGEPISSLFIPRILAWAILNHNLHLLSAVMRKIGNGINLNSVGYMKTPPLHLATNLGYSEVVLKLLELCDIQLEDSVDRKTALHVASERKHYRIFENLIQRCPIGTRSRLLDRLDVEGRSTLHCAIDADCVEILRIISATAEEGFWQSKGEELLLMALAMGSKRVTDYLFSPEIFMSLSIGDRGGLGVYNSDLILWMLHMNSVQVVPHIISMGISLDLTVIDTILGPVTPLHFSLEHGKLDLARLLIEKGADLHSRKQHTFSLDSGKTVHDLRPLDVAMLYWHTDVASTIVGKMRESSIRSPALELEELVLKITLDRTGFRDRWAYLLLESPHDVVTSILCSCGELHQGLDVDRSALPMFFCIFTGGITTHVIDMHIQRALSSNALRPSPTCILSLVTQAVKDPRVGPSVQAFFRTADESTHWVEQEVDLRGGGTHGIMTIRQIWIGGYKNVDHGRT